jgi:ribosomal protein S17
LIFIFFLFKSILISVKNRKVEKIIKVDIQKIEKNPFLQKLEKIEKNLNKYNKSEFFSSINDLLREYIEFS